MNRLWRLDDNRQTLILTSADNGLPEIAYWGRPLPKGEEPAANAHLIDVAGGMLDEVPPLSICPEASRTFPGQAGMQVTDATGKRLFPNFRFAQDVEKSTGVQLDFTDDALGLSYSARFEIDPLSGLVTATATLKSTTPIRVNWLAAPVFPGLPDAVEMIEFAGRWCGEFQENTVPWAPGMRARNNQTGRSGHEHFPGLIVPAKGTTNTMGRAIAFHYGWSGGHGMVAEELPDGRRQIQFGNAPMTETETATHFETAPLYAAYSMDGLNGCAIAFQRHLRDRIVDFPDKTRPRPVHYNCWEAVYFDHDIETLKDIANRAARIGAERFVLDDGWFGARDDDTTSLGDWDLNRRKFPDGLGPLIDHVKAAGMTFGIWFEPEMVNPESNLFRAHPDWVLGPLDQPRGRHQLVLDMEQAAVRDYLFDAIASVLSENDIDYIKWDHNRVLAQSGAGQTRGTYTLLDRLRGAFPKVEIESCASGGGRIDFGILARTHRVWLSDSNDALERLKIQHGAALFLPMVVTGSHVGPRECHTSGRHLDIRLRAWTAAQRHMGFEMDPRELTEDEETVLTRVTNWWKDNRHWLAQADILRLDSADPSVIAEIHVVQERFVGFVGKIASFDQIAPRPLRLTGLDPNARYEIDLANRDEIGPASRGEPALKCGPIRLSGAYLMEQGLQLPLSFPETIWVIEGRRL